MESWKVLVILVAVIHCSVSRPSNPENELRVIVRQLERLVARTDTGTPDSPPGPRVPDDDDSDSTNDEEIDLSEEVYKMLFEMFDRILKPYFGSFPSGTFTSTMPLTRERFVRLFKDWFKTIAGNPSDTTFREIFFNTTGTFLNARFQCATSKLNQMIFYVLKDQERALTAGDEKSMYALVKKILGKHITDEATLNEVMRTMVKNAHMHVFGTMMNMKYFLLRDIMEFFGRMRMMLNTAERETWTVTKFEEAVKELMSDSNIEFRCPRLSELWEYHRELFRDFQEMLKDDFFNEAETWLKNYLAKYITDPAPVIREILPLYTKYVRAVEWHFKEIDNHMITGNFGDITTFVSKFLQPDQLNYLKSIFEHLKTTGTNTGSPGAMEYLRAFDEEEEEP
ncbi:uncharacterized protein LOC133180606 [Saccostrea echinata]|uniref:uncharacterized protein LOC133180606 n=1 Tax=Saccostrea echinata TaxID=191078 RepID=UPI002A833E80|nr:uncharacterized protein LOC133180606 [Saccostrea echinata]